MNKVFHPCLHTGDKTYATADKRQTLAQNTASSGSGKSSGAISVMPPPQSTAIIPTFSVLVKLKQVHSILTELPHHRPPFALDLDSPLAS